MRPAILALLLLAQAFAEIRPLTILHTNDLHARLTPLANGNGGFAHLATVVRNERQGCGWCVLVHAGDLVQGTPVSSLFRGLPVVEIANLFGFDAATLGNHDLDYGWRITQQYIRRANYPVVSANLSDLRARLLTGRPYAVVRAGGLRVAIIGLMTEDLPLLTKAADRGPWQVTPVLAAAVGYAAKARTESDVVIVVGHLNPAEEQRILEEAPEIAAVISGHSHRGLEAPLRRGERLIVRVRAYGEQLGRLDMQIDTDRKLPVKSSWRVIPVDSRATPAAPDVARMVARWENEVAKIVDTPIGESRRELSRHEVKLLIERAMREVMKTDFALMNSGGVRDILPKGTILARHVWNIMPFDNRVVVGNFPGARIPQQVAAGRVLDPRQEYSLAVTDFTAEAQADPEGLGGSGYVFSKQGPLLRDLLIEWIKEQRMIE